MFGNDYEQQPDLGADAGRNTIGGVATWLGWALMLTLTIVTAVHAIALVQHQSSLNAAGGNLFDAIRIGGVVLVELFALVTATLLATHKLRAAQKPAALVLEITWVAFAALNLISSFAVEHGGELPAFVAGWVTYGLPVSALVVGVQFYIIMRLSPDAKRADDDAELAERFNKLKHNAKLEVMASPQMQAVIRQMMWQQLPPIVGRQLNLTDGQVAALVRQAPQLLDLNGNGIPDINESGAAPSPAANAGHGPRGGEAAAGSGQPTALDIANFLPENPHEREHVLNQLAAMLTTIPNGNGREH